jgi:hypothetical protein
MRTLQTPRTDTGTAMHSTSCAWDDPVYGTGVLAPPRNKPCRNKDE